MKKTKYFNKKTKLGFDSKKEEKRYFYLKSLEASGQIKELRCQPKFRIEYNGIWICNYFADFSYIEKGKLVVEDVKSEYTKKLPVYRLKKKLMKAFHDIDVLET